MATLAVWLTLQSAVLLYAVWLWWRGTYLSKRHIVLSDGLPPLGPIYLRAVLSLFTKPKGISQHVIQTQEITAGPLTHELLKLQQFCNLCGYNSLAHTQELPLLYPAVETFSLILACLAAPSFPVGVLGGVLSRYTATKLAPISTAEQLTYRLKVHPQLRRTERGHLELDVSVAAIASSTAAEVWHETSTFTLRSTSAQKAHTREASSSTEASTSSDWVQVAAWQLDSGTGRRFARLNGDINPIHLHAFAAKCFGFRSHMAHGMFLLARCASTLAAQGAVEVEAYPQSVTAHFKRPSFLPGKVICLAEPSKASTDKQFNVRDKQETNFAVAVPGNTSKPLIVGSICVGA